MKIAIDVGRLVKKNPSKLVNIMDMDNIEIIRQ